MLLGKRSLARRVESDHGDGNARLKHDARRLRIHVNIELGRRRDISSRQRSAHHDDAAHHRRELGIEIQGGSDIGQRAYREQRHFAGIFADDLSNEFAPRAPRPA